MYSSKLKLRPTLLKVQIMKKHFGIAEIQNSTEKDTIHGASRTKNKSISSVCGPAHFVSGGTNTHSPDRNCTYDSGNHPKIRMTPNGN